MEMAGIKALKAQGHAGTGLVAGHCLISFKCLMKQLVEMVNKLFSSYSSQNTHGRLNCLGLGGIRRASRGGGPLW